MVAALVARYLIPLYGWQSLFYVGGAVPVAIATVALFRLPESTRFLALENSRAAVAEATVSPGVFARVVCRGHGSTTTLLVLVIGLNLFMLYFTLNWLR
jgi:AAHS family 4-hydroxybenzoate transporter-like MFS transporter